MEPPVVRSARLLAAILHGQSSPVLENSVFELTSRPICGRLFLLQNAGLRPSDFPRARPPSRAFVVLALAVPPATIATANRRTCPPTPKPVRFLCLWEVRSIMLAQ